MKSCSKCFETKPVSEFYFKAQRGKYNGNCKSCYVKQGTQNRRNRKAKNPEWEPRRPKTPEELRQYGRDWRANNPEKMKSYIKKYRSLNQESVSERNKKAKRRAKLKEWGITEEGLKIVFDKQGGVCAICKEKKVRFWGSTETHLDHCHKTNKFRGFLCYRCNMALGKFADDPERLMRAADYVKNQGS
jgi:hypothetical protein